MIHKTAFAWSLLAAASLLFWCCWVAAAIGPALGAFAEQPCETQQGSRHLARATRRITTGTQLWAGNGEVVGALVILPAASVPFQREGGGAVWPVPCFMFFAETRREEVEAVSWLLS